MKQSGIVFPVELEIINDNLLDEGGYKLNNQDSDLVIDLVKEGTDLNKESTVLNVRTDNTIIAGDHFIKVKPSENGLMPRNFSKPFEFMYANENVINKDIWLGQSELGCREYRAFGLSSTSVGSGILLNVRIFEYNGNMYMTCESYNFHLSKNSRFVNLYKYQDEFSKFNLIHRFYNAIVDENDFSSSAQQGSPDYLVIDDELYIVFRIANYKEGINQIVVNKALNTELTEWQETTRINVENSPSLNLTNFRLRACYGNKVFMIVYYGTFARERDIDSVDVEDQDMRSFTSYDRGYSFKSSITNYQNIIIDDNGDYVRPDSSTNMAYMFLPNYQAGSNPSSFTGFNVNFGLYFDKTMSSFVILKAGDPSFLGNRRYLMGIKTVSGNYDSWESCLKYRLDVSATGDVKTETNYYDFDVFNETLADDSYNSYTIEEVEILSGETVNYLFMVVKTYLNQNGLSSNYKGTVFSEFRFVPNNLIQSGFYDKIFAYGGKFHPDYSFVSSVINKDYNGLVCTGNNSKYSFTNINYSDISATYYKGRIVSTCKNTATLSTNKFLCFMNNFSNVGERVPYQHSITRYIEYIADFDYTVTSSLGFTAYDSFNYGFNYSVSNVSGYVYNELNHSSGMSNSPNTMERASLSSNPFFKVRIQAKISNLTSSDQVKFFSAGTADHISLEGYSIQLSMNATGQLIVQNILGTTYATINGLNTSSMYEFLVGVSYYRDNSIRGFVWYKELYDLRWTYGSIFTVSKHVVSLPHLRFGIISTNSTIPTVLIGDVSASSYENGYRPSFKGDKRNIGSYLEGPLMYAFLSSSDIYPYSSGTVKTYSPEAYLHDGSVIKFSGTPISNDDGSSWNYTRTYSINSLKNIINEVADLGIDLTGNYDTDNPLQIVFENTDEAYFDTFSLINIAGIYEFVLTLGEYDIGINDWITSDQIIYSVPYIVLEIEDFYDKRIIVNNEVFPHNNLKNFTISMYNTSTNQIDDMLLVTQNYDNLLEVNKAIASFDDIELRLHYNIATYSIEESYLSTTIKHMSLTLRSLNDASLIYLGEVVFGKMKDLTNFTNQASHKTNTEDKLITSQENYMYYSIEENSNNIERIDLSFRLLSDRKGEYNYINGIVSSIYNSNKPVVLLFSESDNSKLSYYCSPDIKPDYTINGLYRDIKLPLIAQSFYPKRVNKGFNSIPYLDISVSNSEPYIGESVTFQAFTFDEDGDILSYVWDMGDGNFYYTQNPSHSFSDYGIYNVSCTVTDSYGNSVRKTLTVFVNRSNIAYYFLTASGPFPKPLSTNVTVTVIGRDSAGYTVTEDNSTMLIIVASAPSPSNFYIDLDQDGIFNELVNLDDLMKRLQQGQLQFTCYSTSAQTVTINMIDSSYRQTSIVLVFA